MLTRLRNYLISGLLFWIPLILTIVVIKFFLEFINGLVPKEYLPEAIFNLDTTIPGSGIFLLFIIILITGVLVTNILGRRLVVLWEKLLNSIPGFRNIYNILKKVSDTVLNTSSESFKKVFLVQYPSKGIWVIAFQSGAYRGEAESIIGEKIINLFIPTTPNPTSGFFVLIPRKDAYELDMSVEDAFKLVISAGVVSPNSEEIIDKN
ncbi:MAG: DUF502 domain-containing protein [Bacteroidetes bacterium]|nr:DUF502 domain-containing protein [Bacteroidota bacterium]